MTFLAHGQVIRKQWKEYRRNRRNVASTQKVITRQRRTGRLSRFYSFLEFLQDVLLFFLLSSPSVRFCPFFSFPRPSKNTEHKGHNRNSSDVVKLFWLLSVNTTFSSLLGIKIKSLPYSIDRFNSWREHGNVYDAKRKTWSGSRKVQNVIKNIKRL